MTILLIVACIILVLLPPKYDPAIRIKEWQMRKGKNTESNNEH
jgi:hypothetical protein